MRWATFWAIVPQTLMVTLHCTPLKQTRQVGKGSEVIMYDKSLGHAVSTIHECQITFLSIMFQCQIMYVRRWLFVAYCSTTLHM
jgi:hypothetical protein